MTSERNIFESLQKLAPVVDIRTVFRRNNARMCPYEYLPELAWQIGTKLYTEILGEDYARTMVEKATFYNQHTGRRTALDEFADDVGISYTVQPQFSGNPQRISSYVVTVSNTQTAQGVNFAEYLVRSFEALLPFAAAQIDGNTVRLAVVSPGNLTFRGRSFTTTIAVSQGRV